MSKADRARARQELQEANDVLSNARNTSGWSARDREIYEEGLQLTRLKQQDANRRLG